MLTKGQARELISQLERVARESFGAQSETAHRKVRDVVSALSADGPSDNYFREKLSDFEMWAHIGLSAGKYERYPGGLAQVRIGALGACANLKRLINRSSMHD
jgi:hypothetical protein